MTSRNKNDVKKLFEYWCELNQNGSVAESFPENFRDKKTIGDIPAFTFPCEIEIDSVQSYSFVLTTDDSKWRYGFCRYDPKAKSAMVLITYLPWHDTFLRFLTVLADLRRSDNDAPVNNEFREFLKDAYNRGVPNAGESHKVPYNNGLNCFVFERPAQFKLPSIPENHNLNLYYNFVDPKNMIAVFAAMLAERRIIFTSRRLDRLSSCIQAAHAFLYPMVWQHIFIPILPMKLKDYLSAPMPYLIGVPEPVLEMMTPEELGEVVIMNCDTKIFESPFDDVHELPNEVVSQLKKQLSNSNEHIGDRVSKIFLGILVQLIGTYRDGVEFRDSGKVFNRERFIESRPAHLRRFLTKMMELQIFQQFIDERLDMLNTGLGYSDEFELETARYAEKMKKRHRNYNKFILSVKDKTNPAVKSAVKSMKEGSRGVKTAYKDLKSKILEIPPNSTNFRSHLNSNSQHDRIDGYQLGLSKSSGGGHRSAPNSPIFGKRLIGGSGAAAAPSSVVGGNFQYASPKAINGAAQHLRRAPGPAPLVTSSSSAQINSVAAHAHNHLGGNLGASPTISPASSLCSSDMNLSQELQNHPLFQSPTVDRSLKPLSANSDSNPRFSAAKKSSTQSPQRPPLPVQYYNHPYMAQRSATHLQLATTPATLLQTTALTTTKPPQMPRPKPLSPSASTPPSIPSLPNRIITTDSIYDNPPEMQSPPIPPRRQYNSFLSDSGGTSTSTSTQYLDQHHHQQQQQQQQHICLRDPSRSSSSNTSTISSSSSSSNASFVSALSSFSQHTAPIGTCEVSKPVPVPRTKREKELHHLKVQHASASAAGSLTSVVPSTSSQEDTMNDLISLDDSHNSSFDLEDFDPLNQNARPLPLGGGGALTRTMKSTTLPSTTTNSVHNPLYPYFIPMANINCRNMMDATPASLQPPPLPSTSPPHDDDDFELLRKYGLDQFTITTTASNGTSGDTNISNNNSSVTATGMRNWTTFD